MIIVSQDKTMIFNYENIEVIGIKKRVDNGNYVILVETVSDNQYPIAEYKTEERAKEVMEEIVKTYKDTVINIATSQIYDYSKIYGMPEE